MDQKQLLGIYLNEAEAATFLPIHEKLLPKPRPKLRIVQAPDGYWEVIMDIQRLQFPKVADFIGDR